ncbi:DinB family protein [Dyadobacter pollutisoli]|uniref:DinB family protein n=1 Tax=Dyadobacter pollutisoli TaxID=2910158 RepID=A0A9E8NEN7_9BACT|nr:DinB family protein [Dyadobacter pollutisoli]WAC12927.1 DinB family protein [Dyadobacter pollutisoli]
MIISEETKSATADRQLFIKMVVSNWELQNQRFNGLIDNLSDEQMLLPVAAGKNRAVYLLGHMIAVNDGIIPLLGLGERLFPDLETPFVKNPDDITAQIPSVAELRGNWVELNKTLTAYFNEMSADEWFTKHSAISEENFAKEPHRNKLNILINRTNHEAYHLGQLIFLKP